MHRKLSMNVSSIFLTKEKEVPAMLLVCLQPDRSHRLCSVEEQIINYQNHSLGKNRGMVLPQGG